MPIPAMAVAAGAGSAISALGQYLGEGEMRKLQALQRQISQWKFGEGKALFAELKKLLGGGTVFRPGQKQSMIGKNRQAMQGTFDSIMAALGQKGDLRNPVMGKMFAQTYMPMEAGFQNKLSMFDLGEMSKLRSGLLQTTFG